MAAKIPFEKLDGERVLHVAQELLDIQKKEQRVYSEEQKKEFAEARGQRVWNVYNAIRIINDFDYEQALKLVRIVSFTTLSELARTAYSALLKSEIVEGIENGSITTTAEVEKMLKREQPPPLRKRGRSLKLAQKKEEEPEHLLFSPPKLVMKQIEEPSMLDPEKKRIALLRSDLETYTEVKLFVVTGASNAMWWISKEFVYIDRRQKNWVTAGAKLARIEKSIEKLKDDNLRLIGDYGKAHQNPLLRSLFHQEVYAASYDDILTYMRENHYLVAE